MDLLQLLLYSFKFYSFVFFSEVQWTKPEGYEDTGTKRSAEEVSDIYIQIVLFLLNFSSSSETRLFDDFNTTDM